MSEEYLHLYKPKSITVCLRMSVLIFDFSNLLRITHYISDENGIEYSFSADWDAFDLWTLITYSIANSTELAKSQQMNEILKKTVVFFGKDQ